MRQHSYTLRHTWPGERGCENDYLVIDEEGEKIARIHLDSGSSRPRWKVSIQGTGYLPIWNAMFNASATDLEDAKAKVRELWPLFRAHWTDEEYEKSRRMRRQNEERERQAAERRGGTKAHTIG